MLQQNNAHHKRFVNGYHFLLSALLLLGFIASLINIYLQISEHNEVLISILITVLFMSGMIAFYYLRQFPLRAQDRVIRAEENKQQKKKTCGPGGGGSAGARGGARRGAPGAGGGGRADRAAK